MPILLLLGLTATGSSLGAGPVAAQASTGDGAADPSAGVPSIRIVSQDTHVASTGVFTAEVAIDAPSIPFDPSTGDGGVAGSGTGADGGPTSAGAAGYMVSTTVFGVIDGAADDGPSVGADDAFSEPLNRRSAQPLDQMPMTSAGRYRIEIPLRPGPSFDHLDRALLPLPGVYPLSVELRTPDGPVATARTYLIRLPDPDEADATDGAEPASGEIGEIAVVLPIGGDGLTVDQATAIAATHPDVPLAAVLSTDALITLRADGGLAAGLADAMAGRLVTAAPTLDLDPSALAEVGHGHLFHQTHQGLRTELAAIGLRTDPSVAVLDAPLTDRGIDVLTTAGIRLVIDPDPIGRPARADGPASTVHGVGADRLTVVSIDREMSRIVERHGAAAGLAKVALTPAPGIVSVLGPGIGSGGAGALSDLLGALDEPGAPPVVAAIDPGPAGHGIVDDPPMPGRPVDRPQQDLTPIADLLVQTENLLATYEGFHDGGGTDPSVHRHAILAGLDRSRTADERRAELESVRTRLNGDMAVIDLPTGQPVTMAARSATIPVVVENRAPGPRTVMLRFRSDKVSAADNGRIVTVEPGTSSIDVELEARSLGASPLRVAIMTPDGDTVLAANQFEIRSTAVPGLGLLVSVGALSCLLAWWFLDARKRRRARADAPADA